MSSANLINIDRLFFLPNKLLRFLFITLKSSKKRERESCIVIIKLMGIGSLTLLSSMCEKEGIDKNKITLITFHTNQDLCLLLGFPNTLFIRHSNLFYFLYDCIYVAIRIREHSFLQIINYERCSFAVSSFCFCMAFVRPSMLLCFEDGESKIYGNRLEIYSVDQLTTEKMFRVGVEGISRVGIKVRAVPIRIEKNKVVVNCNASNYLLARRYPAKDFIKLIEILHGANPDLHFLFTGSTQERSYVEEIINRLAGKKIAVQNMAGKWSLNEFCQELSNCNLFITCDSGPLHLAAYMEISTLALWGPTQPYQFGYENLAFLKNSTMKMNCAPCLNHLYSPATKFCEGKITCFTILSPERIIKDAIDLLSDSKNIRTIKFPQGMITRQLNNI